uniref:Netrin receptor UNC5 n=1 Tax=Panagrellus redivivus TaxID=6233 RepID=A0A7E4UX97_PANRE
MTDIAIVEHPQSGYVVRSTPATIACKALNALNIRFKCNSKWLDADRNRVEHGSAEDGQPYLRAEVEITRQEVEAVAGLGDFDCRCYAYAKSIDEAVRSGVANVRVAYIRKQFHMMPTFERVPEGHTVQLTCTPPDADPKADVIWMKNGAEIKPNDDPNLIIANDGNLIISAPRLSDSGHYHCEARNIANKRVTEDVEITVYVDGEWSPWSSFSGSCNIDCALLNSQYDMVRGDEIAVDRSTPKQRRTRTCNNPAPLNGGANCKGLDEDYRTCEHECVVSGSWSRWAHWSECNSQCQRTRKRECIAPPPSNGGSYCPGTDFETVNCTEGSSIPLHCAYPGQHYLSDNIVLPVTKSSSPIANADESGNQFFLLFLSFGFIGILILLILGLLFILFCRKKKGKSGKFFGDEHVRTVLLTPEQKALLDIGYDPKFQTQSPAQFLTLSNGGTTANSSTLNHSYTIRSAKSYNSGYSINRKGNGSRAQLIGDYSSGSASGASTKTAMIRSGSRSSADENYATLYDYVGVEHCTPPSLRTCMEEFSGSEHDQSATIVAAQVDSDSSRIELKRSGVSLVISENTFPEDRMIFLSISADVNERPILAEGESGLSSVITFGLCETEPDTIFTKPVIIMFDHCASVFPKDNWQFVLYADWGLGLGWEIATVLGEENLNTPVYLHMERERCRVMSENFGRFFLAGRPKRPNVAAQKRVRFAAYVSPPEANHFVAGSFGIRVYCVPEVGMAVENVRKQEETVNGVLLAQAENFLMREQGSLCICLEDIAPGFTLHSGSQYLEIANSQHQWCSQNGLHCALSIESTGNVSVADLTGRMVIYQKGNSNDRQVLEFDLRKPEQTLGVNSTYRSEEKLVSTSFQLNAETKRKLVALFGPPARDPDHDWRGLARKLGFDRFVEYFGTRLGCKKPAALILDLWEAGVFGSERALLDLLQTLRVMGRPDAVQVLDDYLSRPQYDMALNV